MFLVAATALAFGRFLVAGLFGEVGELVSTQQHFATLGNGGMTVCIAFVYGCLYLTGLNGSFETTLFLDSEEEFPCLLGDGNGEVFDIV